MSASREKRARKGTQEEILNQQITEASKKKAQTKKNVMIGIAVVLVVTLLIGSIVLFKGPYFLQNTVAVQTGSHELSPVEVRYFYYDAYQQIAGGTNGSLLSMMFEEGAAFDEEIYDQETGETWGDYIMSSAMENIRSVYAIYDLATEEGFTLSEEGTATLEDTVGTIELYSQLYGVTADDYIRSFYGRGSSMESYEEYQRLLIYVSEYLSGIDESFEYDAATLAAKYEESPGTYDLYNYRSYLITADTKDEDGNVLEGEAKEAALEETRVKAEEMAAAAANNEEAYLEYCAEISGNEAHLEGKLTNRVNVRQDNMSVSIRDWVTDPARQPGETAAIQYDETGYYVVYFNSSSDNNYDALNLRCIYITANVTADDGTTTLDWDTAREQADALVEELEGAEDILTAIDSAAMVYSDDENTMYNGGRYEYVYKGQFEDIADEWLFGENAAAAGDSTILEGEEGIYYLYLEGPAGNYRDYLVSEDLRAADYEAWYTDAIADAVVAEASAMNRVDRVLYVPTASASAY